MIITVVTDVLIRAVRRSRHAAGIQLHFAGHGPVEKRLRRMSSTLANPAQFGYYSQAELIELIRRYLITRAAS